MFAEVRPTLGRIVTCCRAEHSADLRCLPNFGPSLIGGSRTILGATYSACPAELQCTLTTRITTEYNCTSPITDDDKHKRLTSATSVCGMLTSPAVAQSVWNSSLLGLTTSTPASSSSLLYTHVSRQWTVNSTYAKGFNVTLDT